MFKSNVDAAINSILDYFGFVDLTMYVSQVHSIMIIRCYCNYYFVIFFTEFRHAALVYCLKPPHESGISAVVAHVPTFRCLICQQSFCLVGSMIVCICVTINACNTRSAVQ